MKCISAALVALFVVFLPAATPAQCPPPPATSTLAEGQIGLFFDPLGTETCGYPGSFTPLYVVARVPEGGIAEFVIPMLLQLSGPGLQVIGTGLPSGSPYVGGIAYDYCASASRPDPETCPVTRGDLLVIAQITVMALGGGNGTACFQTGCPTFIGYAPFAPTYVRCDSGEGTFAGGEMMCIGIGEPPTPVEAFSWGAVKAIYR